MPLRLLALALLLVACDDGTDSASADATPTADALVADATRFDAALDAAVPDAASPDAVSPDAASPDAASPDAATPDALTPDAATPDAACDVPAPGLSGDDPTDGWGWTRQGLVFEGEDPAANDGDLGASLVGTPDGLRLYFTRKTGLTHRILTSLSEDGTHFSAPVEVVGLPEDDFLAWPDAHWVDGQVRLYFMAGRAAVAESADGVVFEVLTEEALPGGEAEDFDSLAQLYPTVAPLPEGGFGMWYTGFNGQTYAIGLATSDDGLTFSREGVVLSAQPDTYASRAVAQPRALAYDGGVRLWYGAYDTRRTDPGPWRVALAESADGRQFERVGVSVPLPDRGFDVWSTRDPGVAHFGGRFVMVYSGLAEDMGYRLLLATSTVCP